MVEDKEQRIETLQDRVDELEATVSKMLPSRRDALKLGAAGAVGAVGMAGSASAQNSNQVGTIGTDSDRVDVNAEDIDAVSVNTEELDITPVASGTDTISANSEMELTQSKEYSSSFFELIISTDGTGGGRLRKKYDDLTADRMSFRVEETAGTETTFDWILVRLS